MANEELLISDMSAVGQMGVPNPQRNTAQSVHDTLSPDKPMQEHQEPPISDQNVPFTQEAQRQLIRILSPLTDADVDEAYACWRQFDDNAARLRATSSPEEKRKNNNYPTMPFLLFLVKVADAKRRCSLQEKSPHTQGH